MSLGATPVRNEKADTLSGVEWRGSQEDWGQMDGDAGRVQWRRIPELLLRNSHLVFPGIDVLKTIMQNWTNARFALWSIVFSSVSFHHLPSTIHIWTFMKLADFLRCAISVGDKPGNLSGQTTSSVSRKLWAIGQFGFNTNQSAWALWKLFIPDIEHGLKNDCSY